MKSLGRIAPTSDLPGLSWSNGQRGSTRAMSFVCITESHCASGMECSAAWTVSRHQDGFQNTENWCTNPWTAEALSQALHLKLIPFTGRSINKVLTWLALGRHSRTLSMSFALPSGSSGKRTLSASSSIEYNALVKRGSGNSLRKSFSTPVREKSIPSQVNT